LSHIDYKYGFNKFWIVLILPTDFTRLSYAPKPKILRVAALSFALYGGFAVGFTAFIRLGSFGVDGVL